MRLYRSLTTAILAVQGVVSVLITQQPLDGLAAASSQNHKDLSEVIASSPLLSLHRALVETESISNNELAVAKFLTATLEAHNFTVTLQEVAQPHDSNSTQKRYNVYAVPDHSKSSSSSPDYPQVLLTSHIDTVPPFIPYTLSYPYNLQDAAHKFNRSQILISGRGTVDAKACVAAMVTTAFNLVSTADLSPPSIGLLFVVGEETGGEGMRTFSESELYQKHLKNSLKGVIFGEPTEGKLASGHKGIQMAYVVAEGKAAHSGYPWLGRSANSMILPALLTLDGLGDISEEEGGLPSSEKYGRSTVNVGWMEGGVAANVVPQHAAAKVAMRLAGGTSEEVKGIVRRAIAKVDPKGLLDVTMGQGYGPVGLDADVDGFDSMTVNYGTDVPNLEVGEGVKRYLYGAGSILVAHGADEALTAGDLEEAVVGYGKLVEHVLKL